MPVFDVRNVVRVPDRLLAETENPRHRKILMNFRRHAMLEVSGRWKEILVPEMMTAEPVYRINEGGRSFQLVGMAEIGAFYASIADRGLNVFGPIDEVMAVADWGLATNLSSAITCLAEFLPSKGRTSTTSTPSIR